MLAELEKKRESHRSALGPPQSFRGRTAQRDDAADYTRRLVGLFSRFGQMMRLQNSTNGSAVTLVVYAGFVPIESHSQRIAQQRHPEASAKRTPHRLDHRFQLAILNDKVGE